LALDKDEGWLRTEIVQPRTQGRAAFVSGQVIEWDDVDEIHITETERSSSEIIPVIRARRAQSSVLSTIEDEWYVTQEGIDVTERFLSGPPGQEGTRATAPVAANDPSAVMVVHGQDEPAARALFDWLRAVGLRPREWSQLVQSTEAASPFIGDVLDRAFREVQAVVALFTPDERVTVREELTGRAAKWRLQARPNVLFEAGMAFATHPDRTVLTVLGDQELPSDLSGRHYVRLGTAASLRALAQRLETAGCPVDLTGDQWLDDERFPNRSALQAEPRIGGDASDPGRDDAYSELLAAHGALLQAYAGTALYEKTIRAARLRFDTAQGAVLVRSTATVRKAAEELRGAWRPRVQGLYMGSGRWQEEVEEARRNLVTAISAG
jgi:predicted nucleotide-binding protein